MTEDYLSDMANETNWSSTESRKEREKAKELLKECKKAKGKEIMVMVDNYHLCLPATLTKAEIKQRIERHKKLRI